VDVLLLVSRLAAVEEPKDAVAAPPAVADRLPVEVVESPDDVAVVRRSRLEQPPDLLRELVQFFCAAELTYSCSRRRVASGRATSSVRSVEKESTTRISSANLTDARQAPRFRSSLKVGTITESFSLTIANPSLPAPPCPRDSASG
jgi:hypothetical protein